MSHTGVAKVTISLPRDLLAKADAARGDEPRSTWIARTLGAALAGGQVDRGSSSDGKGRGRKSEPSPTDATPAAPRRAPAKTDAPETSIEAYMREFR